MERWVEEGLGARVAVQLFRHEHLSVAVGLRLDDGRDVVVKVRPGVGRAAVCVAAQAALHGDGYPCPEGATSWPRCWPTWSSGRGGSS